MKQFITQEQYDSLSDAAKQVYITWTLAKSQETGDHTVSYRSIGHLIWFLDDHLPGWWKIERATKQGTTEEVWRIRDECYFDEREYVELCDALWEAVKLLLESEA